MADLKVIRADVPYTDLPQRMSTLDARILLRDAGLADLADSFEPRAGATRVIWAREPSGSQLDSLGKRFDELVD